MLGEIKKLNEQKEELKSKLRLYVKDKTISLDNRWNCFIESKLGINSPYIERFDCKVGKEYLNTREQRYETHDVQDIMDWLEDLELDEELSTYNINKEDIIEFQEKVLDKFIFSYKFDW